jgi:hypothetical protein
MPDDWVIVFMVKCLFNAFNIIIMYHMHLLPVNHAPLYACWMSRLNHAYISSLNQNYIYHISSMHGKILRCKERSVAKEFSQNMESSSSLNLSQAQAVHWATSPVFLGCSIYAVSSISRHGALAGQPLLKSFIYLPKSFPGNMFFFSCPLHLPCMSCVRHNV